VKAAVLGSPIAHSLSPALHRAAYQALGLTDWGYQAIECDQAALPGLLAGCGPDWAGLSLTMPLKRAVLPLLDRTDPVAAGVGAANTVVFGDGARHGYNTDVPGMIAALAGTGLAGTGLAGTGLAGDRLSALILGAGATACSALAAARELGLRAVTVAARDRARAAALRAAAGRLGVTAHLTGYDLLAGRPDLVISTVPAGAADGVAERIAHGALRPRFLLDVVYHPWPTRLAVAASAAGAAVAGGFDLLVHQAAGQVELMTGQPAPLAAMRAAGLAALAARGQGAGNSGIPDREQLLLGLSDGQPGTCQCWTCKRRATSHLAGHLAGGSAFRLRVGKHAGRRPGRALPAVRPAGRPGTWVRWLRMHAVRGLWLIWGPAGMAAAQPSGEAGRGQLRRSHQRRAPYQRAHPGSGGPAGRPERRAGRDRRPWRCAPAGPGGRP
jgi:shikimate dehydrogenase